MSSVTETAAARAELVAICAEFESWLRHPGNATADDSVVGQWHETITLAARRYTALLRGEPFELLPLPEAPQRERHLHSVEP